MNGRTAGIKAIIFFFTLGGIACDERALRPGGDADLATNAPVKAAEDCLSIVAWNDMHGQLEPDHPVIDSGRIPAGGVVAIADEVATIRQSNDAVVVLDAGDLFTGPLESTLAEGAPIIEAYAAMGVDAVAIGNHEFDFGPVGYARATASASLGDEAMADGPRGALLARMASAPFPFLSANLRRIGNQPTGWQHHEASTTIARGKFRVGVVGYTTRETPTTTLRPNVIGLDFTTDASSNVAKSIRALRANGSAPVVLLAHASIDSALPQVLDPPNDSPGAQHQGELADLTRALGDDLPDLIIAGHRHAWMLGRIRGVPMVSSDQHGVGLARVRFCSVSGSSRTLVSVERRVAISSEPPRTALGEKVKAAIAPFRVRVKAEAESIVTTLPLPCLPQALNGSAFSEQVARAIFEHTNDAKAPPNAVPVVAIVNTGGLRAPLPTGVVRFADLFAAFPFENSVSVCETTRDGFTHLIKNAFRNPSARERFPLGIHGARVKFHRLADSTPVLDEIAIAGANRADDRVWLSLPDFVLWGGDGLLEGVPCATTATSATRVRDALRSVLAREQGGCEGPARNVIAR
ncbi:MAG: bifunctional metallophosphatase/5'-nucleotidase [Polyangiales bacterium]